MTFANTVSKLLINKYFTYFVIFLSIANILGYLAINNFKAIIFFALIGLISMYFSKNVSLVLLIALFCTSLFAIVPLREGLTNDTSDDETLKHVDTKTKQGIKELKKNKSVEDIKSKLNTMPTEKESDNIVYPPVDPNNTDMNRTSESFEPIGATTQGSKKGKSEARVDYATTLEDAYDNLDKMLGSDGINKLTNDTQNLMSNQQKLFDTMNTMAPMVKKVQTMLKDFDMGSLTSIANGLKNQ